MVEHSQLVSYRYGGNILKLLCGFLGLLVATGCCEALKSPVKPPTRLCSRRGTAPEMRGTKDTSNFGYHLFQRLNFNPSAGTDLGLNHPVSLKSHLFHNVAYINLKVKKESC